MPMTTRTHLQQALPALGLIVFGIGALGVAQLRPRAEPAVPLGVVTTGNPADTLRVIAAADGRLLSSGGWLGAAIAVSDDPTFADKLYRAGATFVFRAAGAVGCAGLTGTLARTS